MAHRIVAIPTSQSMPEAAWRCLCLAFQKGKLMGVKVKEKVAGSGVFWVFINYKGKRKSKCIGSEKAALEFKSIIEARLKLGQPVLPEEPHSGPILEDYYNKFREGYLETAVKDSTRRNYENCFRVHILPALGERRLGEVTRTHVKDLIASMVKKGLSRATIGITIRNLCTFINHAKDDGLIRENSATRMAKFYKQAHVVHEEVEPLTFAEVPLFLQSVLTNARDYYPLFLCAIHTGLRSGELVGLQWGDVDFHGKFLVVRRNVVRRKLTSVKNSKIRRVDMSDTLITALEGVKRRRKEEWLAKGQSEIPDWVFCNRDGGWLDPANFKARHFYRCLDKAGLRRIRFHDLRHTFASLLLQNGESLHYVKEQMGHSSIKMTVDIYGHLVPGANRQAVNRLPGPSASAPNKAILNQAK